jgi:hypothetical protein
MKRARWFCLFLIATSTVSFAGDIQVFCPPELRVFLDDEFVGTSSERDDGLFLMNVPYGTRTIRVEKDGFVPQSIQVEVSNFPIEVTVGELSPEPVVRYLEEAEAEAVMQLVGNLVVTSAPQNCVVEIDGMPTNKITPQLSVEGLAAGEHTISFSKPGYDPISGVVDIRPGTEVTVRGNLKDGRIETVHEGKGSLRVISTPLRCTVRFAGMIREKTQPKLNMTLIPAGEYSIVISIPGQELSEKVLILNRKRTIVTVDFSDRDEPVVVSYVPF